MGSPGCIGVPCGRTVVPATFVSSDIRSPYDLRPGRAAVKGHLDAVAEAAARPVIEKYTGVLGAVDVFTTATAFTILESIRLDLGYRMDVRP